VVTPHGGEAARLLGWPPADVRARRLQAAREIADRAGAVCLLKGPDTIVAAPDGTLAVRDGDEPAIATAGAGDVLAGTCGALLARATDPALAAAAAVAAHLEAARAARARSPRRVLIAGDIVDALALG
jgi:NAD(P)H-hydrate epimerase